MKMPKCFLLKFWTITIIILTGLTAAVHAQVDEDELSNLPPVVFLNYEGPHTRIDTKEEIRQIGVAVGRQISEREKGIASTLEGMTLEQRRQYSYRFESGASNRYFVIHNVSAYEDGKLDADIFGLGVDTGVDHIRNLRTIIQGYLQAAYDYSEKDAALLAEYITIYNAVYRGNWDYFTKKYKTPVINDLVREKAGLSIRYDEWPGRTLIVIPLGSGGLSSVDTSVISDSRVIEELRKESDQSVPQRQDMVDLKEREAEEAQRRAQDEREAIRQEERQIAQEREQPLDSQKEQELAEREKELEQRSEEAQKLEEFAEQKTEEAQQEREEIAQDQQSTIADGNTGTSSGNASGTAQGTQQNNNFNDTVGGLLGITIESTDPGRGRLILFNATTANEIGRSVLNTIHTRTVTFIDKKIIAIAGENRGDATIRLTEINQDTLETVKFGEDDIMSGSLIWVNTNYLYAITVDLSNNFCYLGRFDTNLVLQAKSSLQVHPQASVAFQQGRLLTQNESGSALILNPDDLTESK
ncbi:MAG: hypothetical protein LBC76_01540 [Treponema sp.]|jgi:hypothetical protein|nr:hypothetical protein [Treponema sp.]